MSVSLSAGIVVHEIIEADLSKSLSCLDAAVRQTISDREVSSFELFVVSNRDNVSRLHEILKKISFTFPAHIHQNQKNLGFGRAHNQILSHIETTFHIILNPDAFLEQNSLSAIFRFLKLAEQPISLIGFNGLKAGGEPAFLAKRYPSVSVLVMRGFFPNWLKKFFVGYLSGLHPDQEIERT